MDPEKSGQAFWILLIGYWDELLIWLKMLDIWVWHHRNRFVSHSLVHSVFFEGALSSWAFFMVSEQNRHGLWSMIRVHNLVEVKVNEQINLWIPVLISAMKERNRVRWESIIRLERRMGLGKIYLDGLFRRTSLRQYHWIWGPKDKQQGEGEE